MTLSIGASLQHGLRRSATRSGLVVFLLTLVYQLVLIAATNTLAIDLLQRFGVDEVPAVGLTLPISTPVAVVIAVGALLFGMASYPISIRLVSREQAALATLPRSLFTRRFGRLLVSTLAVTLVMTPPILLGFLLVVPGLYLAVSLQFTVFAIATEDAGPLTAFRRSWTLATGNRWRLLGMLLMLAALVGLASGLGTLAAAISPTAGQLVAAVATAVAVVVTYGVLADAFRQLGGESPTNGQRQTPPAADPSPL